MLLLLHHLLGHAGQPPVPAPLRCFIPPCPPPPPPGRIRRDVMTDKPRNSRVMSLAPSACPQGCNKRGFCTKYTDNPAAAPYCRCHRGFAVSACLLEVKATCPPARSFPLLPDSQRGSTPSERLAGVCIVCVSAGRRV